LEQSLIEGVASLIAELNNNDATVNIGVLSEDLADIPAVIGDELRVLTELALCVAREWAWQKSELSIRAWAQDLNINLNNVTFVTEAELEVNCVYAWWASLIVECLEREISSSQLSNLTHVTS